jgi:biopolymer transport protein ExbD
MDTIWKSSREIERSINANEGEFFMPVKLNAKLPQENAEARIEIIPLIDIMFFLLASFMLVSLSMVNLKSVKVNLPTATTAAPQTKKDLVDISIDKAGSIYLDKKPVADDELLRNLTASLRANPDLRVLISGDKDARHGDVIHALDIVRAAGIEKVAFEIHPAEQGGNP